MPASSLIFIVIIVLWAAYLVPAAIHKHRRAASARTGDRDSQAMRVVVRRAPAAVPGSAAAPLPAALSAPSSRPVLAAGPAPAALPPVQAPVRAAVQVAAASVPAPRAGGPSRVVVRRRRLLATAVALTAAGWVLVATGLAPWVCGAVPSAGLLLVVAALSRHGAGAPARTAAPARAGEATAVLPAVRPGLPPVALHPEPRAGVDAGVPVPAPREQPAASAPAPAAAPAPGWQPVPVPLPTYLLKDKAPHLAPAAAADREQERSAVAVDDEPTQVIDLREHVRVVNG
ncbi:hypothetical protein [Kineococcus sp. SYSU DK006]|uniref:hypothetical protein n=1 Tax=Kineococcus sp. SYSU DK006 TaxID=3383127 RepID=UPI003D7D3CE9